LAKDIRFIKTAPPSFIQENRFLYNSPIFYSLMAAPAALFVFLLAFKKRREEMQGNIGLMKSRKANKVARNRLSAAKKFFNENKRESFLDEMFRALWGFVSDKLHIPVSELTKENVAQVLTQRNVSAESIHYSSKHSMPASLLDLHKALLQRTRRFIKGITVISKLEEEIKMNAQFTIHNSRLNSRRRFASTFIVHCALVFTLCIVHCASCIASDSSADFQKANSLYQKQEYDSAIKIYEKIGRLRKFIIISAKLLLQNRKRF